MLVVTTGGAVCAECEPGSDALIVSAAHYEVLQRMADSIELMGTADEARLPVIWERDGRWVSRVSRGTFNLWFQFETRFMDYLNFEKAFAETREDEDGEDDGV